MRAFIYNFLDVLGCTALLLGAIFMLSKIPVSLDVINPISKALGDFQLTDIVFSQLRERTVEDKNIVIVNIGELDRAGIAQQVNIINHYGPKAIGIDVQFIGLKDPAKDSMLADAFSRVKNLVLVSDLMGNKTRNQNDSLKLSHPMFTRYAETGFADLITEGVDNFKTSRVVVPKDNYYQWLPKDTVITFEKINGELMQIRKINYDLKDTMIYSFPTKLAWYIDSNAVKKYLDRKKETEIINYQGNIDLRTDGVSDNSKNIYTVLDWYHVMDTAFVPEVIKDKVVIMGYMGPEIGVNDWEDKVFTPLNKNYIGKTYPDMYGVVVHANVISMILRGEFIDEMPEALNLVLSVILIFLNIWFITYCYFRLKVWYDGFSNFVVLLEVLLMLAVVVLVFNYYNYKFDVTLFVVALFLTGNFVEIYQGIIKVGIGRFYLKWQYVRRLQKIRAAVKASSAS